MKWARHVACIEEMKNAYKISVEKPERKRIFGSRRHRWEDNIKMDLREIGWEVVNWMHRGQGRDQLRVLVNTVMNFRVP
jgi:hypothetical protein